MRTIVTIQILAHTLLQRARTALRDDRGSITIETVLWAVAVIAIVAIVVTAIRAYVTAQAGNIK